MGEREAQRLRNWQIEKIGAFRTWQELIKYEEKIKKTRTSDRLNERRTRSTDWRTDGLTDRPLVVYQRQHHIFCSAIQSSLVDVYVFEYFVFFFFVLMLHTCIIGATSAYYYCFFSFNQCRTTFRWYRVILRIISPEAIRTSESDWNHQTLIHGFNHSKKNQNDNDIDLVYSNRDEWESKRARERVQRKVLIPFIISDKQIVSLLKSRLLMEIYESWKNVQGWHE